MKKLVIHIITLLAIIMHYSINIEATAVHKFIIYERCKNKIEKQYVIRCFDNHTKFSDPYQIDVIKKLIDQIPNALFVFSDPFDNSQDPLEYEPMNLFKYAFATEKLTKSIKEKFTYDRSDSSSTMLKKFIELEPGQIADFMEEPIAYAENEVAEIQEQLKSFYLNKEEQANDFLVEGLAIYVEQFKRLVDDIEKYKEHIKVIRSLENKDNLEAYLLNKYKMGDVYSSYILFFLHDFLISPNLTFLHIFKAILDGQEQSKIFIFQEEFFKPDLLNNMLEKLGYTPIHTYTCEQVDKSSYIINEMLNMVKTEVTNIFDNAKTHATSSELAQLTHTIHSECQNLPNIPHEELYSLLSPELCGDFFTNSYPIRVIDTFDASKQFVHGDLQKQLDYADEHFTDYYYDSFNEYNMTDLSDNREKGKEKEDDGEKEKEVN